MVLVLKRDSDRWLAFGVGLRARALAGGWKARLQQLQVEQCRLAERLVRDSGEYVFNYIMKREL